MRMMFDKSFAQRAIILKAVGPSVRCSFIHSLNFHKIADGK